MKKKTLNAVVAIWVVLVATAFWSAGKYFQTAGEVGLFAKTLPQNTLLKFDNNFFNLIAVLHPECECSQATVSELERLQSKLMNKLRIHAIFVKIRQESPEKSSLWKRTNHLQNSQNYVDDGNFSHLIGARTSGQILLYSPRGEMIFAGGITQARGHEGPSRGQSAIYNWINTGVDTVTQTPVYGCHLFSKGIAL